MAEPATTHTVRSTYIHGTAPQEQERLRLLNALSNEPFLRWIALREDEVALEVGSGLGLLCAEAARRVPRGRVVGVEISAAQIAQAPRAAGSPAFVRADALRLPFAERSFDRAWCRYVLEHVADPLSVLREMHRVLAPGGRAHAQENDVTLVRFDPPCPAFDSVWSRLPELQHELGGDARVGTRLFRLFVEAGFDDVTLDLAPEIHWSGSPGFADWVENIAGNVRSVAAEMERRGLATRAQLDEALAELEARKTRPDASAFFAWNRATGIRG